jgi:hypothetical protein
MNRIHIKFIKWISNKFGYKIAILKASNGVTTIEGDRELLRYVDVSCFTYVSGYFFKKEPLSRINPSKAPTSAKEMFLADPVPDVDNIKPITKLTPKQLKELGLSN